jgi:hypothetical protein
MENKKIGEIEKKNIYYIQNGYKTIFPCTYDGKKKCCGYHKSSGNKYRKRNVHLTSLKNSADCHLVR